MIEAYLHMKTYCFFLLLTFFAFASKAQTAAQLNDQSKTLLAQGDAKSALPILKKAAELGSAEAQYNYGICFQQGIGEAKSDATAHEWFLKSAAQGSRDAQFKVAYSYTTGRGVARDYRKAFQWSLKCAEQSDTDCMFNVVTCYMMGAGTAKNIDSGLVWAVRLAKLPNPENLKASGNITNARTNLDLLYRDGKELKQDLVQSYAWYLAYNENKRDSSVLMQAEYIKGAEMLEKELTKAQRQLAQTEIERLLGKPLRNLANLHKEEM